MRNTIIGIIIGVVTGVMIGATVVAPSLKKARDGQPRAPENAIPAGAETLGKDLIGTNSETRPGPATEQLASAHRLRIVSLYASKTPILGELPQRLKATLSAASGGRLAVSVYDPGILVESADTLNAVKSGTVEGMFATPSQFDPDAAVLQLFTAIPFGPDAQEYLAWYYHGGGRELFQGAMKKRGLHATLCGAIPPSSSGWYRAPVRSSDDFKGLNIRATGLGGEVLAKLGANIKHLNVGDILSQFEQGELDGAEHSLPSIDAQLGFQKFARNYYFPGWSQPVTLYAMAFNAQIWKGLTASERTAIDTICGDNVRHALTQADASQFDALKNISLSGIQVRRWSGGILHDLKDAWKTVTRELVQKDPDYAKTWNALQKFRADYAIWHEISRSE